MKHFCTKAPHARLGVGRGFSMALLTIAVLGANSGCGAKKRDTRAARTAAYDADFAIVFSEVIRVVEGLYPEYDDDPVRGVVKTAWHQVNFNASMDDPTSAQVRGRASGPANATTGLGNQVTSEQKRFFVRFDIKIIAPRPFEISITPHAAEWDPGNAVPSEMKSNNIPPWLPGRTDALRLKIYRGLKKHAVARVNREVAVAPKADPLDGEVSALALPDVAPEAAKVIREVFRAAVARDALALRPHMLEEFTWDTRSSPSAATAIVVWQADPSALASLERAIAGGCTSHEQQVVCGTAVFGQRGADWKLVAFVATP